VFNCEAIAIVTDHFPDGTSEFRDVAITAGEPSRPYAYDEVCIVHNFHDIVIVGFL
jgi:hypothetical protein